MKDAAIAILDEPTSGLDPQATAELLAMIRELKHDGVAVLLSSHLLDRVQSVCDRVALFQAGDIVLMGTVEELGRQVLGGGLRGRGRGRKGRGSPTGCASCPACAPWRRPPRAACGCSPSATCARRPPPPWSAPAAG